MISVNVETMSSSSSNSESNLAILEDDHLLDNVTDKLFNSAIIQADSFDSTNKMSSTLTEVHELTQPTEPSEQTEKDKNDNLDSLPSSAELPDCFNALKNFSSSLREFFNHSSDDYREIAKCCGLAIVSIIGLFVSVVLLRFVRRVLFPEDAGWFCNYFAGPFCPLFDALCAEQESYMNELFHQVNTVSNDTYNTFNGFFKSIFDGFHALYTIFWAIFGGAIDTILNGYAELQENMGENVSHLVTFVKNSISHILHFLSLIIQTVVNSFIQLLSSAKNSFSSKPTSSYW